MPWLESIVATRRLYDTVIAAIRTLVAAGHVNLVETLAERVAAQCLAQQGVLWTKVRVEKLDIAPDAAAVHHAPARRREGGVDVFGAGFGFVHWLDFFLAAMALRLAGGAR